LPGLAHGPPYRAEQGVVRSGPPLAFDDCHPVRAVQIVIEGLGPCQRALVIGPGQQLMDQVAAQPQFCVRDPA